MELIAALIFIALIFLVALYFWSLTFPLLFRVSKIKKIAGKFNLSFDNSSASQIAGIPSEKFSQEQLQTLKDGKSISIKTNLFSGQINGHNISVYDLFSYRSPGSRGWKIVRQTCLAVDSKEKYLSVKPIFTLDRGRTAEQLTFPLPTKILDKILGGLQNSTTIFDSLKNHFVYSGRLKVFDNQNQLQESLNF